MMILDVSFREFKKFRVNNFGFYWCETPTEFILAKAQESSIVRCRVKKTSKINDLNFRVRLDTLGVKVSKLTFFDEVKSVVNNVLVDESTSPEQVTAIKRGFNGGVLNASG